jgi:hypothetical protein
MYKLGVDGIIRQCMMDHERVGILWKSYSGVVGGNYKGKAIAQKVLQEGLWWPIIFKDAKEYDKSCDVYQRNG